MGEILRVIEVSGASWWNRVVGVTRAPRCSILVLSCVALSVSGCNSGFPDDPPPDDAPAADFADLDAEAPAEAAAAEGEAEFLSFALGSAQLILPQTQALSAVAALAGDPTSGTWVLQGPGPITGGQVRNLAPNNSVVGAIHTVVADPLDADRLYVGSVNGGVWRTEDATAAAPTWTPLIDDFDGLSTSALEMDPFDPDVLLAGQGSYSSFAGLSDVNNGVLRSTDGGNSWTQIDDPLIVDRTVSGVAPRGATLVVSTRRTGGLNGGLFRSIDTGASWNQISGNGTSGLPGGSIFDLVGDPADPTRLYCSVSRTGIYMSTNTGASWVNISSGDPTLHGVISSFSNNNTEMAVSPATGRLFAAVLLSGQAQYIGYTDNQGASWTAMDIPIQRTTKALSNASNATPIVITSANHGLGNSNLVTVQGVLGNTAANGSFSILVINANIFSLAGSSGNGAYAGGGTWSADSGLNPRFKPGGQGGTHWSIVADPIQANTVFIGGDRQDRPFPNLIGAIGFYGNLWRGNTNVAPAGPGSVNSPQWDHHTDLDNVAAIPGGGTAGTSAPHADSREAVFDANGNLIQTDDGGISRRTSPGDNTGDWTSIVGNLSITELHDVAYDSNSNILIGGAQDVGTPEQTATNSTTWRTVSGADGGDVQVDDTSVPGFSIRYSSSQNLGGFRRRACDAANVCGGGTLVGLNVTAGNPLPTPQFVTPVELNRTSQTRLIIGYGNGPYESLDAGANIAQLAGPTSVNRNALYYGHANDADFIALGSGSRVWTRTGGVGSGLQSTGGPGFGPVVDVKVDPANLTQLFAVDGARVFESPDGGTTWNNITGDLPGDIGSFQVLEYIPNGANTDRVVLGTNDGVYLTPLNALGAWFKVGTAMPSALVYDMDYDQADDVLVAGTMGRSAYTLATASQVNIPPVALCMNFEVEADATCMGDALASDIDDGSFDPDGGPVTLDLAPAGPYALGDTEVTLTVTDDEGAMSECGALVSVIVSDPDPVAASGDTYARQGDANYSEGGAPFMHMVAFQSYQFLRFDPAAYNPNGNLHCVNIDAVIDVAVNYATVPGRMNTRDICAHRVTTDWVEGNGFYWEAAVPFTGTGPGLTFNCAIDIDTSNDVPECAPAWDLHRTTPQPWLPSAACDTIVHQQIGSMTFDVADDLAAFVDPGGANPDYGFALVKVGSKSCQLNFGTKEGGAPAILDITVLGP